MRDAGVKAARLAMAFLVIVLHQLTSPSPGHPAGHDPSLIFPITFGRAAVPFFFIVAGFYLKAPASLVAIVARPPVRLLPIYAAWAGAYALFFVPFGDTMHWSLRNAVDGGAAFHLWFLPALMTSLILVAAGLRLIGFVPTAAVAALLLLIGPVGAQYWPAVTGDHYSWTLGWLQRQFAAPALVMVGVALRRLPRPTPRTALAQVAAAYALLLGEETLLASLSNNPVVSSPDVLLTTLPFGAAIFQLARSLDFSPLVRPAARLGHQTLATYLVHVMLLWSIRMLIDGSVPIILATFASSCLVATILVRIPGLRRFAT